MQPLVIAWAGLRPTTAPPRIRANTANKEVMNFGRYEVLALCILYPQSNISIKRDKKCSVYHLFGKTEDLNVRPGL
jgi:hypothetical protein